MNSLYPSPLKIRLLLFLCLFFGDKNGGNEICKGIGVLYEFMGDSGAKYSTEFGRRLSGDTLLMLLFCDPGVAMVSCCSGLIAANVSAMIACRDF